jgi:transposase
VIQGIDLKSLSHAEKDELILSLVGQLEAALARIGELEKRLARLERPAKTPDNFSLPPSQGQKPARATGDKPPRKSRPGFGRTLHPNPDRVFDAVLTACPKCQAAFPATSQTPQQIYERIELPPIKPDVTQVRLFGGRCACCGERVTAVAPAGLEPGSPFGQSIAALVVYLHYAHAIGMERLARLMNEIFSLTLSEGAISNMLARAGEPLLVAAATIRASVLASPVVCSDETSARVSGKNWWEWVFVGTLAVLHVIRPSRGKAVVQALFGEALCRRVRRYRLQCTIQAAAAAGYCYRATTRHAEGHHVEALSRRPGSPAQPHHGSGSAGRSGTQASQAHRRKPGAPVRVHH